ncbi:solute carrier family 66 member 3 isoform X5 [Meles meles]|uniref:solute carrier family 66 member 3 isoform X5 n=1 Tax=Meles meles TaxID=9662 RepID=UPI001E6996C8|nr:solute carrier family 66 member 3 isoform X5 [Meles meles]
MRAQLLLFCNWSTLGVCGALKLPQISAVLAARSARGISLPSLLLELAGFLVFLRYQCYYEYPLLTYLEYPILIAQDVLLLLCVFHFNGNVRGAVPYLGAFVASWFVLPLQKWTIDLAMLHQRITEQKHGPTQMLKNLILRCLATFFTSFFGWSIENRAGEAVNCGR